MEKVIQRLERICMAGAVLAVATMMLVTSYDALARYAFEFTWNASPWVPLLGALAGAVLALAAGWWGLREVLRRPVIDTLRAAPE